MSHNFTEPLNIDSLADLLPAFEFDCLLGQDHTGVLYKAHHRSLARDVAIKILPIQSGNDPRFRDSFQAKAKAMARLSHPRLIRVYDSGDLDGHLYTVMEYVHGQSLLRCAHGKAIDPIQAVEIVTSACEGLAHAHDNGVVHGDIRPANIFLNQKCEPKIGNFGVPGQDRNNEVALASDASEYMAPEIATQQDQGGPQADVFALGVILRELLTGIPATSAVEANDAISDPKLDDICRTATHPDPALRYPDARSLAESLNLWKAESRTAGMPRKPQPILDRPLPANRRPALACQSPAFPAKRPTLVSLQAQRPSGKPVFVKCSLIASILFCAAILANRMRQTELQPSTRQLAEQRGSIPNPSTDPSSKPADTTATSPELAVAVSNSSR